MKKLANDKRKSVKKIIVAIMTMLLMFFILHKGTFAQEAEVQSTEETVQIQETEAVE